MLHAQTSRNLTSCARAGLWGMPHSSGIVSAPMAQAAAKPAAEHRLTFAEILDWLVEDGVVARAPAEALKKERRYWRGSQHPLALAAEEGWKDARPPHKLLTLDALAEWLA